MISYLKHHQIDKKRWDDTIQRSSNGIIYAFSWYLDIICDGWEALVNEDYSIVMPLSKGNKFLMQYIYPPFFAQQLGIFSIKAIEEDQCRTFFNSIPENYRFIEMNVNFSNQWLPETFTSKKNSDFILNLQENYQSIRKNFSENHDRNIKKSAKNQLQLFKHAEANDVVNMFRSNRGKLVKNLSDKNYADFIKLVGEAESRKMAKIWIVNNSNGVPIAGAVFFESHDSGIFIFSGITAEGRKSSAMHYLIDEYIKENAGILKSLDFEGSNDPELARFYKGFGSTEFVYLQIKRNNLPPPWKWFKK